jgi:MYXO-CTERM domain-containing protein
MEKDGAGVTHLEAHVQIFYSGPADRFSWVVPVDNMPVLDVGTNQLFKVLDPATRPQFGVTWKTEGICKVNPYPGSGGSGGRGYAGTGGSSGAAVDAGAAGPPPGVDISFRGDVGPYDAAVIRSTDANDSKPLKEWLQSNAYYLSPEGGKLIDDYVKEGKYFVAIRLINGHTVNEIQPLVMRFDAESPCIPLRLTSIAAINDLRINLWVLARDRVVPQNYFELVVNPARINWFSSGFNYDALVKEAANQAGGNAFVTDYVGPATMLQGAIYSGRFDPNRIALAKTPPEAMNEITIQGYPRDAALLEILRKYIPEPMVLKNRGVSELQFYNQLAQFWASDMRSFAPFDGKAMAADVNARLVQPLLNAQALFNRYPKLTRLSTFISPEEMTSDPLFILNSTLPDVPAQRVATAVLMCGTKQFTACEAPVRLELPDGQKLFFKPRAPGSAYCTSAEPYNLDRGKLDEAPALSVAYQRESIGEGAVRVNNQEAINANIAAHNLAARVPMAVGGGKGGPFPVGPSPLPMPDPADEGTPPTPRQGSSGCAVGGGGSDALLALSLLVGLMMRRRRNR